MTILPTSSYRLLLTAIIACLIIGQGDALGQLNADFSASKTGGCSPLAITFTNRTTGASANAVYTWDLGNGHTATALNASAIYITEQNYTVMLTVTDGGKTSVKILAVTVAPPPVVDFSPSTVKACLPAAVSFTAATGGNAIASYTWDFGDGNTQTTSSPTVSHTYTVQQQAMVSLTATNSYGCSNTVQKANLVKILPPLTAAFSADKNILCRVTDQEQFYNNSSGPGTLSYLWDFGDGTSATDAAPAHVFGQKGIYNIGLTVTSSEGCVATMRQAAYVNVASFSSDFTAPALVCQGDYVSFVSTSKPQPTASVWKLDEAPVSYYSNSYAYYGNTGTHTLKLVNTFGACPDSVTKVIPVKAVPNLKGFTDDYGGTGCLPPYTLNFKDTTAGDVKWEWNFNWDNYSTNVQAITQAPSFTYTFTGNPLVHLKVTNADGCSAVSNRNIFISVPTVTYNTSINGIVHCDEPVSATFTSYATRPVQSYKWNFGDGTTSTEAQPTHIYTTIGVYSVSLTVVTTDGCTISNTYNQNVTVSGHSKVGLTASPTDVCGNNPVIFTPHITLANTNSFFIAGWEFGDASQGVQYNYGPISHTYTQAGSYTAKLIVSNGICNDTGTQVITVRPPFAPVVTTANSCDGTRGEVAFTQTGAGTANLAWDFGDGGTLTTPGTQAVVKHLYTKSGHYAVKVTVTDGSCSVNSSASANVLLKQSPLLTADKTLLCIGDILTVKISNYDPNYLANNYYIPAFSMQWRNGDGTPYTGYFPYYYNWSNEFNGSTAPPDATRQGLQVITTSFGFGCNDTSNIIPLTLKGSATPNFVIVADNNCYKTPVLLQDASTTVPGDNILSWLWDFGDGNEQQLNQSTTVSHVYKNPGSYNVNLQVTDANGCRSAGSLSYTHYVVANGPKAAFSPSSTNTTITLPVYFYNNTNTYGSPNTQYKWDFGNGNTSTDYNPVYTYNIPGTYTVRLIATNMPAQCADTVTQTVVVKNFNAAFSITPSSLNAGCPPVMARFSNNSVNYTRVTWDFGDGSTADNINYPSHVYKDPGKYIVTLYVYGPSGITGTYYDSVIIRPPQGSIRSDGKEGCIGYIATLHVEASNTSSWVWDFADGSVVTTASNMATHPYTVPGVYQPVVVLKDAGGCAEPVTLAGTITIRPNPSITVAPAQPQVCLGSVVQLNAVGALTYTWQPATGLSDATIAAPLAAPAITTSYTIEGKDDLGCSNTKQVTVTVIQPFVLGLAGDTMVCEGSAAHLHASGANSYTWINTTNGLSDTQSPNPVATPSTTTLYTVTGTDAWHCFTDTASIGVQVRSLPTVSIAPVATVMAGTPVQLSSSGSADIISWSWLPPKYLNCYSCPSPISNPLAETLYTLTVKNGYGCTASDTVTMKLLCEENRVAIPNVFSPNNDGHNDVFEIKGIPLVKHLVIFNRMGNKVFEGNNYIAADRSACWDGTYKGSPVPEGTYVYFAELQCPAGGVFLRKGSVVVVR